MEICLVAWLQNEFGGSNLNKGRRAGARSHGRSGRRGRARAAALLADAVNVGITYEVDATIGNCNRSDYRFRQSCRAQLLFIENLSACSRWFDDEKLSILGSDVKLSVRQDR